MSVLLATGHLGNGAPLICLVVALVLFVLAALEGVRTATRYYSNHLVAAGLAAVTLALLFSPGK